jgi:hypothetical protein
VPLRTRSPSRPAPLSTEAVTVTDQVPIEKLFRRRACAAVGAAHPCQRLWQAAKVLAAHREPLRPSRRRARATIRIAAAPPSGSGRALSRGNAASAARRSRTGGDEAANPDRAGVMAHPGRFWLIQDRQMGVRGRREWRHCHRDEQAEHDAREVVSDAEHVDQLLVRGS